MVLDTNVPVSAVLSGRGAPATILRAWQDDRFQLLTSVPLLDELEQVLARPQIAERLGWSATERLAFLFALGESAILVHPGLPLQVVEMDPSDDRVLEAALEANADYIVSGDRHLLDLGSYGTIPVVTPAHFVAALAID
ncbi:MAG: putative toxin-antitoxin system toxin component, PIN family [Dehalococcoidia bacterium]